MTIPLSLLLIHNPGILNNTAQAFCRRSISLSFCDVLPYLDSGYGLCGKNTTEVRYPSPGITWAWGGVGEE